ncbi:hypothetical protein MBLNU459_g0601t1 [Dothideomycetes sp. NU459]
MDNGSAVTIDGGANERQRRQQQARERGKEHDRKEHDRKEQHDQEEEQQQQQQQQQHHREQHDQEQHDQEQHRQLWHQRAQQQQQNPTRPVSARAADAAAAATASPPAAKHQKQPPAAHKRSLSGSSILARLNFLRTTPVLTAPEQQTRGNDMQHVADDADEPGAPTARGAMAFAQSITKQRRRKGSLRKTALLGTGRLKAEVRERKRSDPSHTHSHAHAQEPYEQDDHTLHHARNPLPAPALDGFAHPAVSPDAPSPPLRPVPHVVEYAAPVPLPLAALTAAQRLSVDTTSHSSSSPVFSDGSVPTLASPILSPTSQSYASTTDDEEALVIPSTGNAALKRPPIPSAGSYFPLDHPIQRRRSSTKSRSPLSALPMDAHSSEEEWDYSNTEWWGWVVLIVTWLFFVVGMGSCFDVWSWAWDVGQTPYAPPELEDDPTLPIVGYYPALIILAAVMAWVWVVVAWVGMKYFKHAKMAGEDP